MIICRLCAYIDAMNRRLNASTVQLQSSNRKGACNPGIASEKNLALLDCKHLTVVLLESKRPLVVIVVNRKLWV